MAVVLYRSDDTDAPVLDGTRGSYIDVLRAVLVDGYSSGGTEKVAAGWSVALDNQATEGVVILQNSTISPATGKYFRIQDNGHSDHTVVDDGSLQSIAYVRGCESYNALDSTDTSGNFPNIGLAPCYDANPDNSTMSGMSVYKHLTDGSTTVVPWIITADDRTMNIIIMYNKGGTALTACDHTSYFNYLVMGDSEPLNGTADPYASVIWGNDFKTADSTNDVDGATGAMKLAKKYLNRGHESNAGAIEHGYLHILKTMYAADRIGAYSYPPTITTYAYPHISSGGLIHSEVIVYEDVSAPENTDVFTVDTYSVSSKLRGVRALGHQVNFSTITGGVGAFLDTLTIDGNDYIIVAAADASQPFGMLLQVTGTL